jgi:hypothetical protein
MKILYLDIYSMNARVNFYFGKFDYLYFKVRLFRSFVGKTGKVKKELSFVFNPDKARPNKTVSIIKINKETYNKLISYFHMLIIEEISNKKELISLDEIKVEDYLNKNKENAFRIFLIDDKKMRRYLSNENNKPNYLKNLKIHKIYKEISNID